MNKGKVYLVGAGPGNPNLLTIRAREVIDKADIVLYDCLVSNEIIETIDKSEKSLFCTGKTSHQHIMSQNEINNLLFSLAQSGKVVARLKGGDPFLFGRGGEEALFLANSNIDFEVIPGVSSALACPVSAGIPITHRGYSSSLTIITGHRMDDCDVDWGLMAKIKGTLVILMGIELIEAICKSLIDNRKDPETPASVIRWGTTPYQKTIVGSLKNIPKLVKEQGVTPPGIIVIGDVVRFRESLLWFEKKPLFGKKILVLRPRKQSKNLTELLHNLGAYVINHPAISINPYNDTKETILNKLDTYHWLIFTSQNGARFFIDGLPDIRLIKQRIAVIGEKTGRVFRELKITPDFIPDCPTSEALLDGLVKTGISGKVILIGEKNPNNTLLFGLKENGCTVEHLAVYEIKQMDDFFPIDDLLSKERIDIIIFTSQSIVSSFFSKIHKDRVDNIKIASIGPVTENALRKYGISCDIVAKTHTDEGLASAILNYHFPLSLKKEASSCNTYLKPNL